MSQGAETAAAGVGGDGNDGAGDGGPGYSQEPEQPRAFNEEEFDRAAFAHVDALTKLEAKTHAHSWALLEKTARVPFQTLQNTVADAIRATPGTESHILGSACPEEIKTVRRFVWLACSSVQVFCEVHACACILTESQSLLSYFGPECEALELWTRSFSTPPFVLELVLYGCLRHNLVLRTTTTGFMSDLFPLLVALAEKCATVTTEQSAQRIQWRLDCGAALECPVDVVVVRVSSASYATYMIEHFLLSCCPLCGSCSLSSGQDLPKLFGYLPSEDAVRLDESDASAGEESVGVSAEAESATVQNDAITNEEPVAFQNTIKGRGLLFTASPRATTTNPGETPPLRVISFEHFASTSDQASGILAQVRVLCPAP
jgi:hypothetical protein